MYLKKTAMKNKTWKFALICSLIVMGFTACDDDDEYYYVAHGLVMVTSKKLIMEAVPSLPFAGTMVTG